MDAQGAHRWAGETRGGGGGRGSNYIAKHIGIQNQVLRWLQHFSDRVEERAKRAATEVNGLLEEAGALELDMKTAVVAFDHLTRQRFTEHKVSDDDNIDLKAQDGVRSSTLSQVQAQDYERDILPRYKDALHIGLASCKDHFRKRGRSTTSVFRGVPSAENSTQGGIWGREFIYPLPIPLKFCKEDGSNPGSPGCKRDYIQSVLAMSTYSPLPHIIGSEEYNHDHSCGLADDVQAITDDFSWLREFQGESSDSGPDDHFGSQMLGVQEGFGKGEMDSLVSASQEFKAMLEAALVNPYKFYDDASNTTRYASVENTSTSEVHHNTDPVSARMGGAADERSTEGDNAEEVELLASLQNPDINVHDIYSALVREGLFDAADEIPAVDPTSDSVNHAVEDSAERGSTVNETFLSEEEKSVDNASPPEKNDGVPDSS